MRGITLGLAVAVVALLAGASAAQGPSPAELSFTVRLRGVYDRGAICIAASNELRRARRLTGVGDFTGSAWSSDGERIAVGGGAREKSPIRIASAQATSWRAVTRPRPTERDYAPAWSPDGRWLAFSRYIYFGRGTDSSRAGVWVVEVATGAEAQISRRFAGVLSWSPAGDLIAAEGGGEFVGDVLLLRRDGRLERTIRAAGRHAFEEGLSWSPDGARLALGGGLIVDRAGREVGRYAVPHSRDYAIRTPAWSPDGTAIAYERAPSWQDARTNVRVLGDGDLYLAPVAGGSAARLTATPGRSESRPVWRRGIGRAGTSQSCVVLGTSRRDVIRGTARDDLVDAGGGSDVVRGGGGHDVLVGGAGADVLVGGAGNDQLLGEAGNDRLDARDGAVDGVRGGYGRDRAWVDRRRDAVSGVELVNPAR